MDNRVKVLKMPIIWPGPENTLMTQEVHQIGENAGVIFRVWYTRGGKLVNYEMTNLPNETKVYD